MLNAEGLEEVLDLDAVKISVSNCENQGPYKGIWELLEGSTPSTSHCVRYYQAEPLLNEFADHDCF
jgi:hypothetical protein